MVLTGITVLEIASFLIQMTEQASIHKQSIYCEADHECGQGRYCYHTGYCADCTICSVHHRVQPEVPSCPTKPIECGDCLPGCRPRVSSVSSGRNNSNDESSQNTQEAYKVTFVNVDNSALAVDTAETPVDSCEEFVTTYEDGKESACQQGYVSESDNESLTGNGGYTIAPPSYHEEETAESVWTPYNDDGGGEEEVNICTGTHDQNEDTRNELEESSASEPLNNPLNDSGVLDSTSHASTSSLSRPFEDLKSSSCGTLEKPMSHGVAHSSSCNTTLDKPTSHGIAHNCSNENLSRPFAHLNSSSCDTDLDRPTDRHRLVRRCSDDDIVSYGASVKRQRHDSGTQSLGDAINNEDSGSTDTDQYKSS
ncbi:hypothetical protein C0J52_04696 [Blattella germanica]|nr:hypothetical protein C0J52_04696 [Blattella germanica]